MSSSSSSLFRLAIFPASCALAWFASETVDAYRKVYVVSKYVAHRKGYRFDQYPTTAAALYVPPLAALLSGGLTFRGTRALMDRVLLAGEPDSKRLFDKLSPADYARVRLAPARLWLLVGPATATRASWRELGRVHGLALLSTALAVLWAACIAPVVHSTAECLYAPRGAPLTDASRVSLAKAARGGD